MENPIDSWSKIPNYLRPLGLLFSTKTSDKASQQLDKAGIPSLPKRKFVKAVMVGIPLLASFITIYKFIIFVRTSAPNGMWGGLQSWASAEFSLTSCILIGALALLLALAIYLKQVNLVDVKELLVERDDELTRSIQRSDELQKRLKESGVEQTRIDAWFGALYKLLAVHGITRRTFFEGTHNLAKVNRTRDENQTLISENILRSILAVIDDLFNDLLKLNALCCLKLVEGDKLRCVYSVTRDNPLLESEYGCASIETSIPGQILKQGREQYIPCLQESPFKPDDCEAKLFESFNITGFVACPLRIHVKIEENTIRTGIFFVFFRNDESPEDGKLVRTLTRLFAEHVADILQFSKTMAQEPTKKRISKRNNNGEGQGNTTE